MEVERNLIRTLRIENIEKHEHIATYLLDHLGPQKAGRKRSQASDLRRVQNNEVVEYICCLALYIRGSGTNR